MRTPSYTRQFQKDLKRMKKRGKELAKIKAILLSGECHMVTVVEELLHNAGMERVRG